MCVVFKTNLFDEVIENRHKIEVLSMILFRYDLI